MSKGNSSRKLANKAKQKVPIQHLSGRSSVPTTRSQDIRAARQTTTLKNNRGHFSLNDWYRPGG